MRPFGIKNKGQLDRAMALYEQVLALKPDFSDAHNNLGVALMAQRRVEEAIAHYEQALALNPNDANCHSNFGIALADQGKLREAVSHYESSLLLNPDNALTLTNLSVALMKLRRLDAAQEHAERAFALDPDNADVVDNLAFILVQNGRPDEAKPYCERAITLDAKRPLTHTILGNILKIQGKFDEAMTHYRRSLELLPGNIEAYAGLAEMKSFKPGDADLAAMEAMALKPDLPDNEAMALHFALGKALEDSGDYVRSFQNLRKGNALKRREVPYDEEHTAELLRRIATLFDSSLFERFQGEGYPSTVPIFVLGMPRSGSTLTEQILGSHPQIFPAGELKEMHKAEQAGFNATGEAVKFPDYVPSLDGGILRRMGEEYVARVTAMANGEARVVDKLPANFMKIGLIRLMLPNARIIHTMRDPVDTCVSCYSKLFGFSGPPYTYDMAELGHYYRRYTELMNYWRSVLPPGTILDVVYEDLVDDIQTQARRLIDFVGLPWDERCIEFHKTKRSVRTASVSQVRKPLFRSSLQRWRKHEADLGPLLEALGDLVPERIPQASTEEAVPAVS